MLEVPKNKSKSALLETLIVTGLFMSAFYFLFFQEIDGLLKKYGIKNDSNSKNENENVAPPRPIINPEQYEGRSEYCVNKNDSDSCIKGFPMPNSIDDLIFADKGYISIITKPNSRPFGLPSRALVRLYRSNNQLVYNGFINGVKDKYYENYDDIKNDIVLVKNIFLKTI
jgi:hypothetical protein